MRVTHWCISFPFCCWNAGSTLAQGSWASQSWQGVSLAPGPSTQAGLDQDKLAQLSRRHWAICSVCLLSSKRSATHCRKTEKMMVNWGENTASSRVKMVRVKITLTLEQICFQLLLPSNSQFLFCPAHFSSILLVSYSPVNKHLAHKFHIGAAPFHGFPGVLSVQQWPSGEGWGCRGAGIDSPQPSLQWAGKAAPSSAHHCQLSCTWTTVILPPSSLQNKRVSVNLAAVTWLCTLQRQLPWGTFPGCSPDNKTRVG